MKRLALLAAAGAAAVGLAGCGGHGGSGATPVAQHAPVTCKQQYRAWSHGSGKGVMDALHGVSTAATAGDGKALTAALKHAKPAVARAARHPIPACADPRGYWNVLLMHVNAAADTTGPASSARAAVQDVPKVMGRLEAGVKQAAR
jgi:hypothetical protein